MFMPSVMGGKERGEKSVRIADLNGICASKYKSNKPLTVALKHFRRFEVLNFFFQLLFSSSPFSFSTNILFVHEDIGSLRK